MVAQKKLEQHLPYQTNYGVISSIDQCLAVPVSLVIDNLKSLAEQFHKFGFEEQMSFASDWYIQGVTQIISTEQGFQGCEYKFGFYSLLKDGVSLSFIQTFPQVALFLHFFYQKWAKLSYRARKSEMRMLRTSFVKAKPQDLAYEFYFYHLFKRLGLHPSWLTQNGNRVGEFDFDGNRKRRRDVFELKAWGMNTGLPYEDTDFNRFALILLQACSAFGLNEREYLQLTLRTSGVTASEVEEFSKDFARKGEAALTSERMFATRIKLPEEIFSRNLSALEHRVTDLGGYERAFGGQNLGLALGARPDGRRDVVAGTHLATNADVSTRLLNKTRYALTKLRGDSNLVFGVSAWQYPSITLMGEQGIRRIALFNTINHVAGMVTNYKEFEKVYAVLNSGSAEIAYCDKSQKLYFDLPVVGTFSEDGFSSPLGSFFANSAAWQMEYFRSDLTAERWERFKSVQ